MTWKRVRLELARTEEFPQGSASRAYLVHLPVSDDGSIDEAVLQTAPGRARVRRYWPSEAEVSGHVIRTPTGWAFSCRVSEEDDNSVYHLDTHVMRVGEHITLTEPDGQSLAYRVVSLS